MDCSKVFGRLSTLIAEFGVPLLFSTSRARLTSLLNVACSQAPPTSRTPLPHPVGVDPVMPRPVVLQPCRLKPRPLVLATSAVLSTCRCDNHPHTVTSSHLHTLTLSHLHTVTLSHRHTVTLSHPCVSSHTFTRSPPLPSPPLPSPPPPLPPGGLSPATSRQPPADAGTPRPPREDSLIILLRLQQQADRCPSLSRDLLRPPIRSRGLPSESPSLAGSHR